MYFRIQNVAFVFMLITLAITVAVLFGNSPSTFRAALDGLTKSNTYEALVSAGTAPGTHPPNSTIANLAGWAEWAGFAISATQHLHGVGN